MKKLIFLFLAILPIVAMKPSFDDTATLQTQLTTTTNLTLPAGHAPYFISSALTIPTGHTFNLNGNLIVCTQTAGAGILMSATSSISNGLLTGPWDFTTAGSAGGGIGIRMLGANTTVNGVHVSQFDGYGILGGAYNNLTVTGCTLDKIGYMAFYYDPEVNGLSGIVFTNNTVDRSMLNPASTLQAGVAIRASTANFADTIKNCTITGNLIKMPYNPSGPGSAAVECIEVRTMANSTVSNNTFIGGTIGVSVVHCKNMTISHNTSTNARDCGIEFADTRNSRTGYNKITGSLKDGILFDGGNVFCKYDTLLYDTVRTSVNSPFHGFTGTRRIVIKGCDFTTTGKGYNLQGTDTVLIDHSQINGQGLANTYGIFLDQTLGNVTITAGSIINCTDAVFAFNSTLSAVVNNNVGTNVDLSGTPTQFAGNFTNGAAYGGNNHFDLTFTFGPLPSKTYGAANFSPGAISSLSISYTSSNLSVATIVSGNIHIVGAGTSTITATSGASNLTQLLTVNPAALSITAVNKTKNYGSVNPALTVTYSGFVLSETSANLTTQPTISTTAVTGSNAGTYPITASGAVDANYSISYTGGILTVNQVPLLISADSKSKTQGTINPVLTVTYSGFVNGDTFSSMTTPPTISTTALTGSPSGTYPITASGAVNTNYTISYSAGVLTISAVELVFSPIPSKVYGVLDFNPGATSAASITYTSSNLSVATIVSGNIHIISVGTSTITATTIDTALTQLLTVTKAPLIVRAANKQKNVGVVNPTLTASITGFVYGQTSTALTTQPSLSTTAVTGSPVGIYPINASGAAGNNYSFSYVPGTLTVINRHRPYIRANFGGIIQRY